LQPAVEADLRAIRLALERIAAEEDLVPTTVDQLSEVIRSVKRLETSWFLVLPYLAHENASTAALLSELAPVLPDDLKHDIASLGDTPVPASDPDALDARKANELNGVLRELLVRTIVALPSGEEGGAAHARLVEHFRGAMELRPW
jgi:hypothetical protein